MANRAESGEYTDYMLEGADWYKETESPSSWDNGQCVHNGLFATNTGEDQFCGHCGQMVPNTEL
jgi:hypothetical protein